MAADLAALSRKGQSLVLFLLVSTGGDENRLSDNGVCFSACGFLAGGALGLGDSSSLSELEEEVDEEEELDEEDDELFVDDLRLFSDILFGLSCCSTTGDIVGDSFFAFAASSGSLCCCCCCCLACFGGSVSFLGLLESASVCSGTVGLPRPLLMCSAAFLAACRCGT